MASDRFREVELWLLWELRGRRGGRIVALNIKFQATRIGKNFTHKICDWFLERITEWN
jgi:hypothetical protein